MDVLRRRTTEVGCGIPLIGKSTGLLSLLQQVEYLYSTLHCRYLSFASCMTALLSMYYKCNLAIHVLSRMIVSNNVWCREYKGETNR